MSTAPRYEAGDDVSLRLTITPDGGVPTDGTTVATVTARSDGGTVITPTATPSTDRSRWTAMLTAATAGEWDILWTVIGTGSGVQSYRLFVAPVAPASVRVYATTAQLAVYLDDAPPEGAHRLLRKASRKVDELLLTAIYPVDTTGLPTDTDVAAALAEATCAQAEWWGETGDSGTGAIAALAGSQIGSVKIGTGVTGQGIPEYAPDAVSALRRAGLTGRGPQVYDRLAGGLLGNPAGARAT